VLGHGDWPHGSETLFEAAADSYIPLLWTLEELAHEGVTAGVVISLSPVLLEQLADDRFKQWFVDYLQDTIHWAAENEREFRSSGDGHAAFLARRWRERYEALRESFCTRYNRDLPAAFRRHQEAGHIEIMTSAATHAYLPLLREDGSVQLQTKLAVATYEKHFGRWPRAMWLPECGYRPRAMWAPAPQIAGPEAPYPRKGTEEFLAENGIDYFIIDTHMLGGGGPEPIEVDWQHTLGKLWGGIRKAREPRPYSGEKRPYFPYFVGHYYEDHPPVAVFARDPETGVKVWSADHGYPGDSDYLEFHRKHTPGTLRYWRVTGPGWALGDKEWYHPDRAEGKARLHAGNFLWTVKETLRAQPRSGGRLPVLVAAFDAELFGHWWHEGPLFLAHALRWMHHGGHQVWLNDETNWIWQRIHDAELDLTAVLRDHSRGHDSAMQTLVEQALCQLVLLQASDWPFLITTWTARDYASQRVHCHHSDFKQVGDRLFSEIDPAWFAELTRPASWA
jgi:1,4-alpha-glucan branching enzyme